MNNNYDPDIMHSFRFPISWKSVFRVLDLEDRGILLNWIFGIVSKILFQKIQSLSNIVKKNPNKLLGHGTR